MRNGSEIPARRSPHRTWTHFKTYWLTSPDAPSDPLGLPCRLAQRIFPLRAWTAGVGTAAVRNLPALVLLGTIIWVVVEVARRGGFAVGDAIALVVGLCLMVLVRQFVNPRPLSLQVSVPPPLRTMGRSGDVVAKQLLDRLDPPRDSLSRPRAVRTLLICPDPLPKIEIPVVKLRLDLLADLIRTAAGRRPRIVTGQALEDSDGLVKLSFRDAAGGDVIDVPARPRAEIEILIDDASERLLLRVAPYTLAWKLKKQGKLGAALDAARNAAEDRSAGARAHARAHVLCWRLSVSMDRPLKEQRDCLMRARAESEFDPVVLDAIAQHVAFDDACTAEQRRFWSAMGRAAGFWSRSETDTPEWEFPYIRREGEDWRQRRDLAHKSVGDARAGLVSACRSLRALMDANLAPTTDMPTLAALAGQYDRHIHYAEWALNFSDREDPDGSAADQRNRMLVRVQKIEGIRSQVPNDRIDQALAWMRDYRDHVDSVGEIASRFSRDLAELNSPRQEAARAVVVSVWSVVDSCKTLCKALRERTSMPEEIHDKWSIDSWFRAAQDLKQAWTNLEAAEKGMSRRNPRQRDQVQWSARMLTRLDQWLALARRDSARDALEAWAAQEAWFERRIAETPHETESLRNPE